MLKARGHFKVTEKSIRIITGRDFCSYYYWLFQRGTYYTKKMQLPLHGAHIGVINEKIHRVDCSPYLYLNDEEIWFEYDTDGNFGGFKTGNFMNFWLNVRCKKAEDILDFYGFKKQDGFSRLHLTICNNKKLK